MTHKILTIITALLLIITHVSIAQEQTHPALGLPEGAIARFGKGGLSHVQYSPDGTQIAIGSSIGTWIYDTTTLQPIHLLTKSDMGMSNFTYHPKKNILVSYENDATINLWNTDTGKLERELTSSNRIKGIVFNANGDTVAFATARRIIRILDAKTGKEKQTIQKPHVDASDINCLAFNPNGFMIAAGEESGNIVLWDTVSGKHIQDLDENQSEVRSVAFNNDGNILASGSASDNAVRLWDMDTMQQIQTLKAEGRVSGFNHIAFSADGGLLAAACVNGTIQLWDLNTYQHIKTLTEYWGGQSVSFSPDLRTLASSDFNGNVRIWNIFTGESTHSIKGFYGEYICFAVSPDGKTIACQGNDRTIYLFDAATGTLQKIVSRQSYRPVDDIAYSPDGKTLAGAHYDDITLFDANTGKQINMLKGHQEQESVNCVAFSPDGNTIASGGEDKNVILWNTNTGELKHTLKGHKDSVISVAFSPDGSTLASGGEDMIVHLWDANTGEKKNSIRKHGELISDLSFNPDSKILASAAYSPNIYLWDVATGKRNLFLRKNPSQITSVVFSPDGKFLAFGSATKGVFIYDVSTRKIVHNYVANNRWVQRVAFASDGNTLVSLVNGMVYLWDVSALKP